MAGKRKLTNAMLKEMKKLRDRGTAFFALARRFHVTYHTVKYWLSSEYREHRKKTIAACNKKYIRKLRKRRTKSR